MVNVPSLGHSLLGIELTLYNLLLIKIKWISRKGKGGAARDQQAQVGIPRHAAPRGGCTQ